ncbi:MAG: PfkB family carbohydrate kinase [Pseudomonadota bacterium]
MSTAVAVISSFVMRGSVGLRAGMFALQRRGHRALAVPTVMMPWHPGHGPSTRTPSASLPDQLAELARDAPALDAVLTGYFASIGQVEAAERFLIKVREARPDALIVVDPVTGDENGRYVPDPVAEAIYGRLVPLADVLTPNANELRDISGAVSVAAARELGARLAVITTARENGGTIDTLGVGEEVTVARHARVEAAPRGTGDLFAAVLTSALLQGAEDQTAIRTAAAATLGVVEQSGSGELDLAGAQEAIASPDLSTVTMSTE